MPLAAAGHNAALDGLGDVATRIGLLTATYLTANANSGATSATLNRSVAVGDKLSFNNGTNREVVTVTANPGTTPTFTPALTYNYLANHDIGHAPIANSGVVEPTGGGYARDTSVTWSNASGSNLTINPSDLPTFSVAGGHKIGGFAIFDSSSTFLGSFLTLNIEGFGAAGTYQLTDADVNLTNA